jgi:hypothetical protein
MKMKKIILIILFNLITSVNAKTIAPGVELVSHKTWTTGDAFGHTEDNKEVFFSSTNVRASVNSFYGQIYQNIQMNAYHSFSIQNTSSQTQTYNISMKLCADGSNCIYDSRSYNISSKSSYSNNTTTYLTKSFSKTGSYSLIVSTSISGDSSSSDTSNASIIVSK